MTVRLLIGCEPTKRAMSELAAGSGSWKARADAALVKGDAPAVAVRAGAASAPGQAGEGKANVGRDIRAHSEKLTHARATTAGQKIQPSSA